LKKERQEIIVVESLHEIERRTVSAFVSVSRDPNEARKLKVLPGRPYPMGLYRMYIMKSRKTNSLLCSNLLFNMEGAVSA